MPGSIPAIAPMLGSWLAIPTITFVEKGQWITGISVNYSATSQDNYHFFIFEGINGKSYSFKVSPMLMFSFKDNMAAGGRFSYSRSMVKMDSGSLKLSSDLSIFDADHLYSINDVLLKNDTS